MNRASMLKSRIPDTHYCPRVRRWNTRHGERDREREREAMAGREGDRHGETLCVREIFIFCGADIESYIDDLHCPASSECLLCAKCEGVWMQRKA